jgi:hypothetical protein
LDDLKEALELLREFRNTAIQTTTSGLRLREFPNDQRGTLERFNELFPRAADLLDRHGMND